MQTRDSEYIQNLTLFLSENLQNKVSEYIKNSYIYFVFGLSLKTEFCLLNEINVQNNITLKLYIF